MNALVIADVAIRRDDRGRYCLNDLHRAAGGEKRHQPSDWLRLKYTADLIEHVKSEIPGNPGIASIQGLGTFVSKELVYAYAMWISPAFHLQVIRAYDAMVASRPQESPFPIPPTYSAALRLAADLAEKNAEQAARLAVVEPALGRIDANGETFCPTVAAKQLQVSPHRLISWMLGAKWLYRGGDGKLNAFQDKIDSGLMAHKYVGRVVKGEERRFAQALLTSRGIVALAEKMAIAEGRAVSRSLDLH
jgi:phage antirepressor YoqD-like protein